MNYLTASFKRKQKTAVFAPYRALHAEIIGVRHVQEHNHELYDQLAAPRAVGNLILNDKGHTFSFQNEVDGACTHTLPLPRPS